MEPSRFMDIRLDKVDALSNLGIIETSEYRSALRPTARKSQFRTVANMSTGAKKPEVPSVISIIEPSDGHPQQEHCPDFFWFRPLTWNNPTWTLYWPELII